MKKPEIKVCSRYNEDFIDNESLEKMVKELNEGGAKRGFVGVLDESSRLGTQQTRCRHLLSQPAVAVSNSWRWVPRVTTWPASGLK